MLKLFKVSPRRAGESNVFPPASFPFGVSTRRRLGNPWPAKGLPAAPHSSRLNFRQLYRINGNVSGGGCESPARHRNRWWIRTACDPPVPGVRLPNRRLGASMTLRKRDPVPFWRRRSGMENWRKDLNLNHPKKDTVPGIYLPQLGYATGEGTILEWLVTEGGAVKAGEALAEVAMEKTVHLVTAAGDGILLKVLAPAGAIVPEGEPIGWIGKQGDAVPPLRCRIVGWEPDIAPPPDGLEALLIDGTVAGGTVAGGAVGGGVTHSASGDAMAAPIEDTPSVPLEVFGSQHRKFLRGQLRRVTAQRMARSWVEAPKVDLFAEVEFTRAEAHRAALKAQGQAPPSYNVYIAHAVVKAFLDLPEYNIQYIGGKTAPVEGIHVGMAVALGDNLVTVSLKHLEQAGLLEIQKRFQVLIRKALRSSLTRDELYRSSLTITNLGEFDVTAFTALINPPEAFILAIGKVEPRAVVRDGVVVPAVMCTFCLSFDHRAVDGAPASRLLQRIKSHMESDPGPL